MGARDRVGKGLSYRPAGLQSLAELIHWNRFHKRLKIRALVCPMGRRTKQRKDEKHLGPVFKLF
jgi:hypothetical protein